MTNLELILIIITYLLLAGIVYKKQYKIADNEGFESPGGCAFILAIIAPITLIIYAIRAIFFEDWV